MKRAILFSVLSILATYGCIAQNSSTSPRKFLNDTSFKPRSYSSAHTSDVDVNIPQNDSSLINKDLFVVAIGNEEYSDKTISSVKYASNDVSIFTEYCQQTLSVSKDHIHMLINATQSQIKHEISWLQKVSTVYGGTAKFIFYYAGHGIPDEVSKESYILPVDCYANDLSTAYSLKGLYADLSKLDTENVIVFLDACFSGMSRNGTFLSNSRGVVIKPSSTIPQKESLYVLSATHEAETAYPYEEQQHGLFTYYLLKKIQKSSECLTLNELSDYVIENVKKTSVVINGKTQTPTIITSHKKRWENYRLK